MLCPLIIFLLKINSRQLFLKSLLPDYDSSEPLPAQSVPLTPVINLMTNDRSIEMIVANQFEDKSFEAFTSFWARREDDFSFPHFQLLREWFLRDLTSIELDSLKGDPEGMGVFHFISIMDDTAGDITEHVTSLTSLALNGSAMSQFVLGLLYSTGMYVEADLPRGLLFLKHSSDGLNIFGGLNMASRYLEGLSIAKSCHQGNNILNQVARLVVANMTRWESTVEDFPKITRDRNLHISWDSSQSLYVNYLSLFFPKQSPNQVELAKFYLGDSAYNVDSLKQAFDILVEAHSLGSVEASAHLGHFYLEGTPFLESDYKLARIMFELGEAKNISSAFVGLGMIYLYGLGVDVDHPRAMGYFRKILGTERTIRDGTGFFHYGLVKLFGLVDQPEDGVTPRDLLNRGSYLRNIPSIFLLGQRGLDMLDSCIVSAELNQIVVENGPWRLLGMKAFRLWKAGRVRPAYNYYTFLVEIGVRGATENAAHILYQDLKGSSQLGREHVNGRLFQLLNRLTKQNDGEAHKILADMYYYGIGVPTDMSEAFYHYMVVADKDSLAQFNVGYMYEHGLGVSRDLASAEMYYNSAGQVFETWVSSRLAIYKMRLVQLVRRSGLAAGVAVGVVLVLLSWLAFGLGTL